MAKYYVVREITSESPSTQFNGEGTRVVFFSANNDREAKERLLKIRGRRVGEFEFYKLIPVE